MRTFRSIRRAAWVVLPLLALVGCSRSEAPDPPGRVLVVGIDGASWRMLDPLFERGALPHLARLRAAGASGRLESLIPIQSPRIWNSIATGKTPEKHGIVAFAKRVGRRDLRLYLGHDRKTHALWNIVSDAGLEVAVVNWWNTFPPEAIDGVMISDHIQPSEIEEREELAHASDTPVGALAHPARWQARLHELLADDTPPIAFEDPFADVDSIPFSAWTGERLARSFHDDAAVLRLALTVEAEERPDVMLVFFPGIDRVSHFLWGMIEPPERYPENLRTTEAERAAGRRAFERYYAWTDAMIGALLERFGPDDLVVVLSDHGFEAGHELGFLTGVHKTEEALDGVLFVRGPGIPARVETGDVGVLDVTPSILAWLGLPVGEDMDGRVAPFFPDERVERVATHDTTPIVWLETAASGSDARILENLRALGYLEDEGGGVARDGEADEDAAAEEDGDAAEDGDGDAAEGGDGDAAEDGDGATRR